MGIGKVKLLQTGKENFLSEKNPSTIVYILYFHHIKICQIKEVSKYQ